MLCLICVTFSYYLFCFSYYERAKELHEGYEEHHEKGGRGCSAAYNLAVDWFNGFSKMADQLPNCPTRTLPSCLMKVAVYELYREQMSGKPTLSRASFVYGMWKKHFPQVIIPKVGRSI